LKYKYPLAADTISAEENMARAEWLMTNPHLTTGGLVKQYEQKWAQWLGRSYAKACNSGSSANELMYHALLESKRLPNKKAIVPSAAWVTSNASTLFYGLEPIMCEADPQNWGLDPVHLEKLLEEHHPSLVFLVHVLGVPAKMEEIMALQKKYGFFLLEDTCAAMGSSYHGQKLGTFGDMSSISTYFGHQFSTVEGGMVSTDDKELADLAHMLRNHGGICGLDNETRANLLAKHGLEDIGTDFVFLYPGHNFRFSDDHAFIGLGQLDKMDWLIRRRFENHNLYASLLEGSFSIQQYDDASTVCSIHFCALAKSYEERNRIILALQKNSIETRPFTSGNQGLQPYWFKQYGKFNGTMATRLYHCGFFLPNYPSLQPEDIEFICQVAIKVKKDK